MSGEGLVLIGRVVKPHGLRGEVVVEIRSDVPGRFDPGADVVVGGRPTQVAAARPHQGRLLVRFVHVGDRTAAEGLRGHEVEAPPVDVSESEWYFAHELAGMTLETRDGEVVGEVVDVIELPPSAGYDLLEVERADGRRLLVPAVDDLVVVDARDETEVLVVVDPPEGLLD